MEYDIVNDDGTLKLRTCAICDGNATEIVEERGRYVIKCLCGYSVRDRNIAQALENWNQGLSTYVCNTCNIPCVLKAPRRPEHCTCSSEYDAPPADWKQLEEEEIV